VEEQRRLRSRVRTQRQRNRSSDDVRALRRQADRERKRAACQQATESRRSQLVLARGLICACVYLVITELDTAAICFWLQRFVLEVRKRNGEHFCLDSLHQLCCGLQRDLRNLDWDINFLPVCPAAFLMVR